ncbi:hypothetical protein B0T20DRAFT_413209 [Sordaria brevicollis]|uniref:Uncharacterized protein n=1 Tax=Sordaria brevicollis TaxID=83679 RepID=A0AAE0PD65_SORBR|nr:hypothetical protein B0T20DRAFT_413209 [Sordaria brevicollis]
MKGGTHIFLIRIPLSSQILFTIGSELFISHQQQYKQQHFYSKSTTMDAEEPASDPPSTGHSSPSIRSPSNVSQTQTPPTTPMTTRPAVNYSRPLPLHSSDTQTRRPTWEEKGKDREIVQDNDYGEGQGDVNADGKQSQSQLHLHAGQHQYRGAEDEGYDVEGDDSSSEDSEAYSKGAEEDGNSSQGKVTGGKDHNVPEDQENSRNEYTDLFELIRNIAKMRAFDERVGNRAQDDGSGRGGGAGWYHGVRYLGFREFLERDEEEDGAGGTIDEEDEEEVEEGEENDTRETEENKQKEEKDDGYEGEDEYEDELEYVMVKVPGEETDSDDESWCLVEKEDDDSKKDKDKQDNTERDKEVNLKKYDDIENDFWRHYNYRYRHSYTIKIYPSGTTSTSTSNIQPDIIHPLQRPHPQPQQTPDEEEIPLFLPSIRISQPSPRLFNIMLTIPGCKRKDIIVAYDPNANFLRISGVFYSDIFSALADALGKKLSSYSPDTDTESGSYEKKRRAATATGRGAGLTHNTFSDQNRGSDESQAQAQTLTRGRESNKTDLSFEEEMELWLAYNREHDGSSSLKKTPGSTGSLEEDPNSNTESSTHASAGGKEGNEDDDDDRHSHSQSQSRSESRPQSQSQSQSTTEDDFPVARFSKIINFIAADMPAPTTTSSASSSDEPGEQQQQQQQQQSKALVDYKRIKAKLEDGILTVIIPLLFGGELLDNESK